MSDDETSEIFRYLRSFDNRLDKVQGYLRERHETSLSWQLEVKRLDRRIDVVLERLASLENKLGS